jgi:hypothetical protein
MTNCCHDTTDKLNRQDELMHLFDEWTTTTTTTLPQQRQLQQQLQKQQQQQHEHHGQ